MRSRNITMAGIILLMLAFTVGISTARPDTQASYNIKDADNIAPYEGPIVPGNALYGLKIAFENLDESFTFKASEKIQKKLDHANLRLAEAEGQLKKGNAQAAEIAFEGFKQKSEDAGSLITSSPDINSGLLHAEEMIKKHQRVLYNLILLHPNNPGLARAYNNSLELEQKFNKMIAEREEGEVSDDENVKIKADIIGNDTEVKVSVKFNSKNVTNLTIAQEILNKFQLSTENINTLLDVENIDKGELKTELEAGAKIEKGFSMVEAEYTFPLLNTTSRDDIVNGIYPKLHALTIENITNVLKIENKTNVLENKKGGKEEVNQVKHDIWEERQTEKAIIKQAKNEDKGIDR